MKAAEEKANSQANIIFGPVPSRRLGTSLGVDIVPMKICSYDCIYCELGRTTLKTIQRKEYIPSDEVMLALDSYFSKHDSSTLDYVTFSGSGEPTLHINIGAFIAKIKELTPTPVAVLTNGSLLFNPKVRKELSGADLVIPSLDAVSSEVFKKINRPAPGRHIKEILGGIIDFTREFQGEVWMEILFVKGVNDKAKEIEKLVSAAAAIHPTRVQINTVARPPGSGTAEPLDSHSLHEIASKFHGFVEVIEDFGGRAGPTCKSTNIDAITTMLRIRPMTLDDLSASLGMHRTEVLKYLSELSLQYKIKRTEFQGKKYFTIVL